MHSTSVHIIQTPEQSTEKMDLAIKSKVLAAENLIMAQKKRSLVSRRRALVSECLTHGEKSKAMVIKRTLFAVESLILEDKIKDLAVERITLAMKLKPLQNDPGHLQSDILYEFISFPNSSSSTGEK